MLRLASIKGLACQRAACEECPGQKCKDNKQAGKLRQNTRTAHRFRLWVCACQAGFARQRQCVALGVGFETQPALGPP